MRDIQVLKRTVNYNVTVFLFYIITGYLGLLFAVPPGYATAIWPPSGIALGAVLVWGPGILPGVFFASYVLNLYISYLNCTGDYTYIIWFIGFITGSGAVLQALFGWWLIKKTVGLDNLLHLPKDILLYSLFTGPVACIVASTIGTTGLYLIGSITGDNFIMSWVTWWIGDSIGVLIFTPFFLIAFAKPGYLWKSRVFSILIPLTITFFVVFLWHIFYNQSEDRHIQSKFTELTENNFNRLVDKLKFTLDTEKAMVHFINQYSEVSDKDFQQLGAMLLKGNPYVQSIQWAPKTMGKEAFETKYQLKITSGLTADEKPVYYPILYSISTISPFFSKGYDMLSDENFYDYLKHRNPHNVRSFFVTFGQTGDLSRTYSVSAVSKDNEIVGYILIQINWKKLFEDSFDYFKQYSQLSIKKVSEGLYRNQTFQIFNAEHSKHDSQSVTVRFDYQFVGAKWKVLAISSSAYFNSEYSSLVWTSLITSLFLCVLMNIILFILNGQHYLLELVANAKTFQLQEEKEKNKLLFNATSEGVLLIDLAYQIHFINPAAAYLLGYTKHEILGESIAKVFVEKGNKALSNPIEALSVYKSINSKTVIKTKESLFWKKNGTFFWVEYTCIPIIINAKVNGAAIIFSDITERIENEEKLRALAHMDPLTGIPNRLSFFEKLEQVLARAQRKNLRFALCFIDVDDFKHINDSYGHIYGDSLLTKLPEILRPFLKESDYLARIGGDEFGLIIEGTFKMSELSQIIKDILNVFHQPVKLQDEPIKISLSIGIALYPKNGTDSETLFNNADLAMYHAKAMGKDTFSFFMENKDDANKG